MADLGQNASASEISENIGDVLASIRRLIAQDEANRSVTDPGQRLRQLAQERAGQRPAVTPAALSKVPVTKRRLGHSTPLVLGDSEMVPQHPQDELANTAAFAPNAPDDGYDDAPIRAQAAPGPITLHDPTPAAPHRSTERRFPAPPAPQQAPAPQMMAQQPAQPRMVPAADPFREPHPFTQRDIRTPQPIAAEPIPLRHTPTAKPPAPQQPAFQHAAPAHPPALQEPAFLPLDLQDPDEPMDERGFSPQDVLADYAVPEVPALAEDDDLHLFAMPDEPSASQQLLRDLIHDAIRQELQGELGGQFSRNLRQLIRSEIDLALRQSRRIA